MRRTVEAPYLRGEATRARILNAAVDLFGAMGYDSVSTREIAVASGVPQASLRYYFDNKQRLYVACLEHVQSRIFDRMEPELQVAEGLLEDGNVDVEQLIASFCALQDTMVDAMIGGGDKGNAALLLLRHDLPSAGGSGALAGDEAGIRRLASCFARIIKQISGNELDEQSASRVAGLINGQITNIYLRRSRLRTDGWDITAERLLWLKGMIRKNSSAILQAHRVQAD